MTDPAGFVIGHPEAVAVFARIRAIVREPGPVDPRVNLVAFRRRRGFAPCMSPAVLQKAGRAGGAVDRSAPRRRLQPFQAGGPASGAVWTHHLEVHDAAEIDAQVREWLWEAAETGS